MFSEATDRGGSAIRPANAIDLTGYTKLKATATIIGGSSDKNHVSLRVWKNNPTYLDEDSVATQHAYAGKTNYEIDISGFNGLYVVGFCLYYDKTYNAITINKVWLER